MIWLRGLESGVMDGDEYIDDNAIFFGDEDKPKLIEWLSRAANTNMTDKELISLLDELKK